jgi:hypothetical protein
MEIVILTISILGGMLLYWLHRSTRRKVFEPIWEQSELWFTAKPKPTFRQGEGAKSELYLPLEIEGHEVNLPLPNDYNYLKKLFPKDSNWDAHLFTIPIKCCVVGKDIVGIQYGDLPPRDPEFDTELTSDLTPPNHDLNKKKKRADIFLYLAIVAVVPAACIFLQVIAGWFR